MSRKSIKADHRESLSGTEFQGLRTAGGIAPLATINGTSGNDILNGTTGADSLSGLAGNDTLNGNAGNDTLNGGSGFDVMTGGAGNDLYIVDQRGDRAIEAAGGGVDTVQVNGSVPIYVLPANVENLTSTAAVGGILVGNDLPNVITGGAGGEYIIGGGGNDTLKGGAGNDVYFIESSLDQIVELASQGYDAVSVDLPSYVMPANVESLEILSPNGGNVTGNSLSNYVWGSDYADRINGAAGDDVIFGRGGNDTLTGGVGADQFDFSYPLGPGHVDHITDFDVTQDWIGLDSAVFGLSEGFLSSTAFKKIGPGGGVVDSSDRILYNQSTGQLYYDPDGGGGQAAILFAVLDNKAALSAGDFWVW